MGNSLTAHEQRYHYSHRRQRETQTNSMLPRGHLTRRKQLNVEPDFNAQPTTHAPAIRTTRTT